MSTIVSTLVTAIETQIAAELGASYSELGYVLDVSKNSYRQNDNRYGVLPLESVQVSGVTRFATYEQNFQIVLTKGYGQSKISDSDQRDKAIELYQLAHQVNKRLVTTKAGSPSNVMNVSNLRIDQPEYLTEEKVAVLRATVTLTYRLAL